MTKTEMMQLNIAVDLDGRPVRLSAPLAFDVVALRAAIAAALLTAILVVGAALANAPAAPSGQTELGTPYRLPAPAPGPGRE
jgi:hypothetical protein